MVEPPLVGRLNKPPTNAPKPRNAQGIKRVARVPSVRPLWQLFRNVRRRKHQLPLLLKPDRVPKLNRRVEPLDEPQNH